MIGFALVALVYFSIGLIFAVHDARTSILNRKFRLDTVFLWIVALDIRLKSWSEIRRIRRGEK